MPEDPEEEPTQHTPKGAEIPVPTREEVLRDLRKVAKPSRDRRNGGAKK
jgi:hypothetical protein